MKKLLSLIALTLFAGALFGAVDGKWRAQVKTREGKRGGQAITTILQLKSDGSVLTGTLTMSRGKRDRTAAIHDGKVEGDKFTFTTVQQGRKGKTRIVWAGTVSGDELRGTRTREGGRREMEFAARRE